jgi:hypothetical protein
MFFLLRCAFWLTIALALLPSGGSKTVAQGPQIGAVEAVSAASAAVSDMGSFCDRQAEACEVGAQAAVAIGQRAQAGAKMVYEFINDRVARSETGSVPEKKQADPKSMQAKAEPKIQEPAAVPAALHGSQHTLSPTDMAPAWRDPPQRREAQPRKGKQPAA